MICRRYYGQPKHFEPPRLLNFSDDAMMARDSHTLIETTRRIDDVAYMAHLLSNDPRGSEVIAALLTIATKPADLRQAEVATLIATIAHYLDARPEMYPHLVALLAPASQRLEQQLVATPQQHAGATNEHRSRSFESTLNPAAGANVEYLHTGASTDNLVRSSGPRLVIDSPEFQGQTVTGGMVGGSVTSPQGEPSRPRSAAEAGSSSQQSGAGRGASGSGRRDARSSTHPYQSERRSGGWDFAGSRFGAAVSDPDAHLLQTRHTTESLGKQYPFLDTVNPDRKSTVTQANCVMAAIAFVISVREQDAFQAPPSEALPGTDLLNFHRQSLGLTDEQHHVSEITHIDAARDALTSAGDGVMALIAVHGAGEA